jgi:hypothetical protein
VQIVGIGGGRLPTGFSSTPMGASVRAPYWGTRTELMEVLDLARAGAVHVEVEEYTLGEAPEAYRRLHEGAVRGRAVASPGTDPRRFPGTSRSRVREDAGGRRSLPRQPATAARRGSDLPSATHGRGSRRNRRPAVCRRCD